MTLYTPWGEQPLPTRSPVVIIEGDRFIFKSPERFSVVRLHTEPNISRIRFPIPVNSSPQVEPDNYPEGFERDTTRLGLRGSFFRGSSFPRVHALQKPTRSLFQRFESLLRVVGLFHDQEKTTGANAPCAKKVSIRSVK